MTNKNTVFKLKFSALFLKEDDTNFPSIQTVLTGAVRLSNFTLD